MALPTAECLTNAICHPVYFDQTGNVLNCTGENTELLHPNAAKLVPSLFPVNPLFFAGAEIFVRESDLEQVYNAMGIPTLSTFHCVTTLFVVL